MKISFGSVFLLLVIFVCFFYFIFRSDEIFQNKFCYGHVIYDSISKDDKYNYNIEYSVFFSDKGEGYNSMRGDVFINGEHFHLKRTVNFVYNKIAFNRFKLQIKSVNITPQDNIPASLSNKYFSFYSINALSYISVKEISPRRLLIDGNMGNLMFCTVNSII